MIYMDAVIDRRPLVEVLGGQTILMSPSPALNHNRVIVNLTYIVRRYLQGKRCEVFSDGVDVHFDEKNTVIPDLMIVCDKDKIKGDGIYGAPDLVVEVLSPSTATRDRKEKKVLYARHGVKEYWIIGPAGKSVEVYLLAGGALEIDRVYTVYPDWQWEKMTDEEKSEAALPLRVSLYDDFVIDVREIFENIKN